MWIIKKIIILSVLLISTLSYLQFKLIRVPHQSKVYNYGVVQCLTDLPKKNKTNKDKDQSRLLTNKKSDQDQDEDEDKDNEKENQDDQQQNESQIEQQENKVVEDKDNFKQICYEKDISYSIQLFNKKKQLMLMSIDLTAPISWVKGEKCYIAETHRKCERIQKNYKDQFAKLTKKFKQILKNPLGRDKKKEKKKNNNQYALIQGSSQVVKGVLQKTQTLQFLTMDTGRLTRFFDLMKLGMFFIGVNAQLNLQNTTFINATQISPALNYLCDGAISLRFDENSQSSFLKEMTAVAQSQQSYVTIFLGQHNQSMTIGDLSVKNAAHGLSGIKWIPVEQDDQYGKLARTTAIQLTMSNSQAHKQVPVKLPLVLTLSSSTITIPQQQLQKIFTKFFPKKNCHINQTTRYMQCQKLSSSDYQSKQLNFVTNQTNFMVPFKNLIIQQKKHKVTFNIKSSLDSRFIILGQPVFRVYFVVLDYKNNRIGLALQRTKFAEALIDAVSLIRFVVWAFILGSCSICFLLPLQRCYTILINKIVTVRNKKPKTKKYTGPGNATQKTRINYTAVQQQNPYEDLRGKIQQVINDQAMGI